MDPFDPNTFAGMYRPQIEGACRKTADCPTTGAVYDPCVANTAQTLEGDPQKRLNFLTNYARCSAFERCDFVTCANGTKPVYGESQRTKVDYSCQQLWACETVAGRAPANVMEAVGYCTAQRIGMLDAFAAAQRAGFEQTFNTCQTLNTCEFVSCFGN